MSGAWTETNQVGDTEYVVRVQLIDVERKAGFADYEDPYVSEFFSDDGIDQGGLYRHLAAEFGRCTGKVFIDTTNGSGIRQTGWCFRKREPYDDVPSKKFLQEAWVTVHGRKVEPVSVDLGGRP